MKMNPRLLFSISATFLSFLLFTSSLFSVVQSTKFKIVNKCRHTIWPGILTGANRTPLTPTGFILKSGKSITLSVPRSWSGRIWGRTDCSTDPSTGKFSCLTADCGSGRVECAGSGAVPPATLAEFTLNGDQGLDFYDVSLVDGYNLPMLVVAKGGTRGGCSSTGCLVDLNGACPPALRVAAGNGSEIRSVACKSACEAFGDPAYCCSEGHNTPDTCQPSEYSLFFKHACPRAYSYAYDDKTSTFTCASPDYLIIFCPLPYTRLIQRQVQAVGEYNFLHEPLLLHYLLIYPTWVQLEDLHFADDNECKVLYVVPGILCGIKCFEFCAKCNARNYNHLWESCAC